MDKRVTSKKLIFIEIILSILFLGLSVAQIILATKETKLLPFSSFQGLMSVAQLLLAVSMVVVAEIGIYFAFGVMMVHTIYLVLGVIRAQKYTALPGLAMMIVGMIICFILNNFLKKLKIKEDAIINMAHTDALTDLPNRRALKQYMNKLIRNSDDSDFAVVMVDLDNFKYINDSVGHEYGDWVLADISSRWRSKLHDNDYMCRLGGDEFVLVINNYENLLTLEKHLSEIRECVNEKMILADREFYMTASMGLALYPGDSKEASQLLKYADVAMFEAKNTGKNRLCYYDSVMNESVETSIKIDNMIRNALDNNGLRLMYQPQFNIQKDTVRGYEALVRMVDENGNYISPGEFIPIAEKSSLIMDIGRWVLRKAMNDFKIQVLTNNITISVNISANHLLDENFLRDIDSALTETGFPPENLELELTESVFVNSIEKAAKVMEEIKKRGIHLAIDDFGTGFSSLSYLRMLPFDLLKIDKAFIDNLTESEKDSAFVEAIITIGKILQYDVISEGVETKEQWDMLKGMKCDMIQGFYKGRPMEYNKAVELLR